jgi:hypothetical protein
VDAAKAAFVRLFLEKSGNVFGKEPYEKKAGFHFPLAVHYLEPDRSVGDGKLGSLCKGRERVKAFLPPSPVWNHAVGRASLGGFGCNTSLPKPVVDVLALISNKDVMASTLREMQIDTEKMPLGALSKP